MAPTLRTLSIASAAVFIACSSGMPEEAERPVQPPAETARVPEGQLDRGQLEVVLRQGPAWLFQHVPIEEVMEGENFVGWRIQDMPTEWRNVDLLPGDVVTSVNGMQLETPNDFWTAWTSLTVASELKIAYTREGEPREVSVPIYGTPSPELAKDLQDQQKKGQPAEESPVRANQEYAPPKHNKTITIKGDDQPMTDTMVDWSNTYE